MPSVWLKPWRLKSSDSFNRFKKTFPRNDGVLTEYRLLSSLFFFLPTCLSVSFPSFLPLQLPAFVLASCLLPPSFLPSFLPSFPPSFLPSFLSSFLPACLPPCPWPPPCLPPSFSAPVPACFPLSLPPCLLPSVPSSLPSLHFFPWLLPQLASALLSSLLTSFSRLPTSLFPPFSHSLPLSLLPLFLPALFLPPSSCLLRPPVPSSLPLFPSFINLFTPKKFDFLLQPHPRYYTTLDGELGFSSLLR